MWKFGERKKFPSNSIAGEYSYRCNTYTFGVLVLCYPLSTYDFLLALTSKYTLPIDCPFIIIHFARSAKLRRKASQN